MKQRIPAKRSNKRASRLYRRYKNEVGLDIEKRIDNIRSIVRGNEDNFVPKIKLRRKK